VSRDATAQPAAGPSFAAECVAVFVGGAAGALVRYGIVELLAGQHSWWPWATFIANLVGCAILSLTIALLENGRGGGIHRSLVATGFCGGLTTFSTFQLELYVLIDAGRLDTAIAYALSSILLGLLVISFARRFVARGEEVA
jgi:CrcB protein